jgi:predicted nucleic-acid-binding Zn-ribbon protein
MATRKNCPDCGGTNLYASREISARGGYGPDLLPGASLWLRSAKMKTVVCKDCGLIRFYAVEDTLGRIHRDTGWERVV